jgi:hypothetical protein
MTTKNVAVTTLTSGLGQHSRDVQTGQGQKVDCLTDFRLISFGPMSLCKVGPDVSISSFYIFQLSNELTDDCVQETDCGQMIRHSG